MPSSLEDLQIPSEFADYRQRLIVYAQKKFHTQKNFEIELLDQNFNLIHDFLITNFRALQKAMTFEIGETPIKVFYLTDANKSVDQAIQSLRQEFKKLNKHFTYEP